MNSNIKVNDFKAIFLAKNQAIRSKCNYACHIKVNFVPEIIREIPGYPIQKSSVSMPPHMSIRK